MCPNAFYINENEHRAMLYCSINGKNCMHSTLCLKKDKYIGANGMENCSIMLANQKTEIPNGSSYIRFEKKGYLYVEYGDNRVVKIKNTIGEIKQNYVYVKEVNGEYVISLKPFKEEVKEKRTYNRKKK